MIDTNKRPFIPGFAPNGIWTVAEVERLRQWVDIERLRSELGTRDKEIARLRVENKAISDWAKLLYSDLVNLRGVSLIPILNLAKWRP